MKKLLLLGVLIAFLGCDSENANDCFQATGDLVRQDYDVELFNKIIVWKRVQLFFSKGDRLKVEVETGENLLNEVYVCV